MRLLKAAGSLLALLALVYAGRTLGHGYQALTKDAPDQEESVQELGLVPQNTLVHFRIPVANTNTASRRITSVSSSCGCTVVDHPDQPLGSGDTIHLPAVLSTKAKPGPTQSEVVVTFDDGTVRQFRVSAFIAGGSLGLLDFGNVLQDAAGLERTLTLPWPQEGSIRIADIIFDAERLEVAQIDRQVHRATEILVRLKLPFPFGPFQEDVHITFAEPALPPASLTLTGRVLAPVEISSYSVAAGLLARGESKSLEVRLYSPCNFPVTVGKMDVLTGPIEKLHNEGVSASEQRLWFDLVAPRDSSRQTVVGTFRIEACTNAYKRAFEVEVTGVLEDPPPNREAVTHEET